MWMSLFVVALADEVAVGVEPVDDLRHPHALAGRAALMRAIVVVGEVFPGVPDDGDLDILDANDPHRAVGKFVVGAYLDFRHSDPSFQGMSRLKS